MTAVNMHDAKTNLSRLVEALVSGSEREIVIARNGKPAVRMTAVEGVGPKRRFGFAKGRFKFDYEAFQALDAEVQRLFEEGADPYGEKLPLTRLLLDTHVLVWWALGNERLSQRARAVIEQDGNRIGVSVASVWEAAIKNRLKRPDPIGLSGSDLLALVDEAGLTLIAVEPRHALAVERLPDGPGDPFDRLLVATAVADTWRLLTHDSRLAGYGDHVIVV